MVLLWFLLFIPSIFRMIWILLESYWPEPQQSLTFTKDEQMRSLNKNPFFPPFKRILSILGLSQKYRPSFSCWRRWWWRRRRRRRMFMNISNCSCHLCNVFMLITCLPLTEAMIHFYSRMKQLINYWSTFSSWLPDALILFSRRSRNRLISQWCYMLKCFSNQDDLTPLQDGTNWSPDTSNFGQVKPELENKYPVISRYWQGEKPGKFSPNLRYDLNHESFLFIISILTESLANLN